MASAHSRPKDPLDALQHMINDVLVHTGKALRASRKDGHGNGPSPHGSIQARLPETIKSFHSALDSLDSDIVRAKSVLLRDLNELRSQRAQSKPLEQIHSHPSDPQSQSPTVVDSHSSPPAAPRDHPIKTEPIMKPVAPFPDMGMSLPDAAQSATVVKEESTPTQAPSATPGGPDFKVEGGASSAPGGIMSIAHQKPAGIQPNGPGGDDTLSMNPGLNFTDMEFTLAPSNNDAQDQLNRDAASSLNTTAESSFDLASFAPAGGADNGNNSNSMASLGGMLPASLSGAMSKPNTADNQSKPADNRNNDNVQDSAFADIFTGDGQADGMDFDFSLGDGGMGGDTFDDLMNDRDNTFNTIEHGDFDATFFGIDKTDGT
ncbi:hypothetical protein HRG_008713 [Hirsutella rhossiliensis]|uniref:Uncharacterized protein n=1 Tax=Hirsutella rhossiliensis TaxID=111463 RepID=A0A9P8SF60_9HYPO|nr:uncharacterized protein HRG_08713 [Hirsutella rhossiliensis]KAH0960558.1 hypothetical protein HRG_08713 [Hirsutella rhossiliensis]